MKPYTEDAGVTLWHGDALTVLASLPSGSVDCCVTSPPYFRLRDYGVDGQYGLEATPDEYVERMRAVFSEVRRVLADDGTLWLNIGDSYSGSWGAQGITGGFHYRGVVAAGKYAPRATRTGSIRPGMPPAKNLLGIPWRVALALQDDGWILRNDIVWSKPNGMPESVRDRLSSKHEYVFLFAKQPRYWFDLGAMRAIGMSDAGKALTTQTGAGRNTAEMQRLAAEAKAALGGYYREFLYDGGRNPGDVWTISTKPFAAAHFAVMAPELAKRCVLAGCKPGGTVLDPFSGSGTTGLVAVQTGRKYVGIDISAEYLDLSLRTRLMQPALPIEIGEQR